MKDKISSRLRNSQNSRPKEDKEYPYISIDVVGVFQDESISIVYYDFERNMWIDTKDDSQIIYDFNWFDVVV